MSLPAPPLQVVLDTLNGIHTCLSVSPCRDNIRCSWNGFEYRESINRAIFKAAHDGCSHVLLGRDALPGFNRISEEAVKTVAIIKELEANGFAIRWLGDSVLVAWFQEKLEFNKNGNADDRVSDLLTVKVSDLKELE